MIMMMISTHSELLSLLQYTIFPPLLENKFRLFPPGDRGQLGHRGPLLCSALACEGRADCSVSSSHLNLSSLSSELWAHSSLCRYQWSPGPDHTPGMTLNTLDTTQTFQKRFSIRSLVICADIWAPHFSYSPIVSFLRYRSILSRQKRQHKRFTPRSRHVTTFTNCCRQTLAPDPPGWYWSLFVAITGVV